MKNIFMKLHFFYVYVASKTHRIIFFKLFKNFVAIYQKKNVYKNLLLRISFSFLFFEGIEKNLSSLSNMYSEEIKLLNNYIQFSSWSYFYLALFVRINIFFFSYVRVSFSQSSVSYRMNSATTIPPFFIMNL